MSWLNHFFDRRRRYNELSESIREHLQEKIEELMEEGMSRNEATRVAHREFGNVTLIEERSREIWQLVRLESLLSDVRYALRRLRRMPGFATTAILTLALGIGANTAIFSITYAVMIKSLPVAKPTQLYRLGSGDDCCALTNSQDGRWNIFSYDLYRYLRENTSGIHDLAAFEESVMDLTVTRPHSNSPADPFGGEFVTGNYFEMFGLQPVVGRLLSSVDDGANAPPVTVMSYRAWSGVFGRDPAVVGSTLTIRSVPMTVVGIAPPGFFGDTIRTDPPDFWFPMSTEPLLHGSNSMINKPNQHWLYLVGRVDDGRSKEQINSELTGHLQEWLANQYGPKMTGHFHELVRRQTIQLSPAGMGIARLSQTYGRGLRLLMAISLFVLLIACANIANLLLARNSAARVQSSVRAALGASRARLIQQAVIESITLGLCGGIVGLAVAYGGARFILWSAFHGAGFVPIKATPSLPVLFFSFAISLAASLIFGIAPTWTTMHSDPAQLLRGVNRSTVRRSSLLQRTLVVTQITLCVVLLAAAGLLTQSLKRLQHQHFGFETQGRLMIKVNPAAAGYTADRLSTLYRQMEDRMTKIPGVISASSSLYSPLEGTYWDTSIFVAGQSATNSADQTNYAVWDRVGSHYFETIGTHLIEGRSINEHDTSTTRGVAIINRAFAERFFPKQDPIGRHFGMGELSHAGDFEIIGVAENAKYSDAHGLVPPMFFRPLLQVDTLNNPSDEVRSSFIHAIEIRSPLSSAELEPLVRKALYEIDPNMAVLNSISFDEQIARNFNREHMIAYLSGLFGLLALTIASVGLYGVMSYLVVQRTTEIGVRMALGANRATILGMILRGALLQALLGLVIGLLGALLLGTLISTQLYDVKIYDPLTLAGTSVLLGMCVLAAGAIPAFRAASIEPIQALRSE